MKEGMKNKLNIIFSIVLVIIILSAYLVTKSFAYFNYVSRSQVNTFSTSEWVPAKSTALMIHNQDVYNDSENVSSYIDKEKENFQINIGLNEHSFLSFEYKINSLETAELFDDPVLNVYISGTKILQISNQINNPNWQLAYIDLANFNLQPGVHDIEFEVQNTFDEQNQSEYQVRGVTTTKLFSKPSSQINFYTNKDVASFYIDYYVFENGNEVLKEQELSLEYKENFYKFSIPENFANTKLNYWSVDLYGNIEEKKSLYLNVEKNLGASDFNYNLFIETDNQLNIQASFVNHSGSSKKFISKISDNPIVTNIDWQNASQLFQVDHQQYYQNTIFTKNNLGKINYNLVFKNLPQNQVYLNTKLCNINSICEYFIKNQLVN